MESKSTKTGLTNLVHSGKWDGYSFKPMWKNLLLLFWITIVVSKVSISSFTWEGNLASDLFETEETLFELFSARKTFSKPILIMLESNAGWGESAPG